MTFLAVLIPAEIILFPSGLRVVLVYLAVSPILEKIFILPVELSKYAVPFCACCKKLLSCFNNSHYEDHDSSGKKHKYQIKYKLIPAYCSSTYTGPAFKYVISVKII